LSERGAIEAPPPRGGKGRIAGSGIGLAREFPVDGCAQVLNAAAAAGCGAGRGWAPKRVAPTGGLKKKNRSLPILYHDMWLSRHALDKLLLNGALGISSHTQSE
jgi:hypothetical protein